MLRVRVIPVLLLRGQGLVKTLKFGAPRYLGDPLNVVRIYNEKEVDEIIVSGIDATREGRPPDLDILERIASEAFMPLCYGGGVRTAEDTRRLLRIGIEKVAVNSAALDDPTSLRRIADRFGSQCVVASVDVKRTFFGKYEVYSHAGRRVPERDPLRWIETLICHGAGEVMVNAVHRDGTMEGYDLQLLGMLDGKFNVPLIACGGSGSVAHMVQAVRSVHISALGAGAQFIFKGPHRGVLPSYLNRDELDAIQKAALR